MKSALILTGGILSILIPISHYAAEAGPTELDRQLIQAGRKGKSFSEIDKLIAQGAKVDAQDNRGWTAVMYAASRSHWKTMNLLHRAGANINATDIHGNTVLMHEIGCVTIYLGSSFWVKRLLAKCNADVNRANNNEMTALMYAARAGHSKTINLLLGAGANVNATDIHDRTPLMHAAQGGHSKIAQRLMRARAHVDATDVDGWTPLMFAAGYGHSRTTKLLLGAGVNVADVDGWTPLMFAVMNRHSKTMRILLNGGADINAVTRLGNTILALIVQDVYQPWFIDAVDFLLKKGADVNASNNRGRTALMLAAERGYPEIVARLLKGGADSDERDSGDNTALDWASTDAVKELLVEQRERRRKETTQSVLAAAPLPTAKDLAKLIAQFVH